ncbi:hypothetical protein [Lachnoclostridium phytofermentans]|uniref:hypothetical protein n=1 Tax=Lachnoclostridium phytofermentans TaxID=66219 RepID=UPI000497A1AC|nr:hypothetical protein [Lachnoclostridium phytofermentans]
MSPRKKKTEIQRKFYYYEIDIRREIAGSVEKVPDLKKCIKDIFCRIKHLKYSDTDFTDKYLVQENERGDYTYLIIDELDDHYIKFRMLLCKDKLLPYIEESGKLEPLANKVITGKKKLAEITHGIIFLESNTLALEYNAAGGRKTDLSKYIDSKAGIPQITYLTNRVNPDTLKNIKQNGEISLLKIKVKTNSAVIAMLTAEDTAFSSLNCKNDDIDSVEIVMRRRTSSKKKGFIFPFLSAEFVNKLFKNNKEDFDKFSLAYGSGSGEINLLEEQFICNDPFIPIEKTKTIKQEEAYNSMIEYYDSKVKEYVVEDEEH